VILLRGAFTRQVLGASEQLAIRLAARPDQPHLNVLASNLTTFPIAQRILFSRHCLVFRQKKLTTDLEYLRVQVAVIPLWSRSSNTVDLIRAYGAHVTYQRMIKGPMNGKENLRKQFIEVLASLSTLVPLLA